MTDDGVDRLLVPTVLEFLEAEEKRGYCGT